MSVRTLDGEAVDDVAECRHVWVAGMMYVADEDLDTVSALRAVECERCGLERRPAAH